MALSYREFTTTKRAQALPAKIGIEQMARMWNAYKAQQGIQVKPRAARAKTSCRSMSMAKCVDPCMWREAKGKKPATCYKPRVLSPQAKAKLRANLEKARGMRRPAAPKVLKIKAPKCNTFTQEMCVDPCAWRKTKCVKPRGGLSEQKKANRRAALMRNAIQAGKYTFAQQGFEVDDIQSGGMQHAGMQHAGMNQNAGYWF
jgi:hypothetical protein